MHQKHNHPYFSKIMVMKTVCCFLGVLIFLSCSKNKDEDNYPEFRGTRIYTSPTWIEISTLHWISDVEIVFIEYSMGDDTINSISIINTESNSIRETYSVDGDITYSVLSDNSQFLYFCLRSKDYTSAGLYRLELSTGLILFLAEGNVYYPRFCVSPDGSRIVYQKNNPSGNYSDTIYCYDFPLNEEVPLMMGVPILFSHDNTALIISAGYYGIGPLTLYSYNLESGKSELVLTDQMINSLNSGYNRYWWLIDAKMDNDHILLTLGGSEDNFLLYDLTETDPVYGGSMEPFNVYSDANLICEHFGPCWGCNFAIDTRKMEMFCWVFECVEKDWIGWSYTCNPYRYNLNSIDMVSKGKHMIGNIQSGYPGITAISPDGKKIAYILGQTNVTVWQTGYKSIYLYHIPD
jgi:hypothetical protein